MRDIGKMMLDVEWEEKSLRQETCMRGSLRETSLMARVNIFGKMGHNMKESGRMELKKEKVNGQV